MASLWLHEAGIQWCHCGFMAVTRRFNDGDRGSRHGGMDVSWQSRMTPTRTYLFAPIYVHHKVEHFERQLSTRGAKCEHARIGIYGPVKIDRAWFNLEILYM